MPLRCSRSLPPELGRAWESEWPRWFGPERVSLPRAPDKTELVLVRTDFGLVVAKREQPRPWKRSLERMRARLPRAERAFRNAEALIARGFLTPEPLAVLRGAGQSVLVTRFVEGRGLFEAWREEDSSERMLELLAGGVARLHAAGFRHRDLKASNLLLRGAGQGLELVWTDLDGLRQVGTVEPRQRARDLARLGTSFESALAREAGVRAGHWPELVRRYLERALGWAPEEEEVGRLLGWTGRWRARWIARHLARGEGVR